MGGNEWEAPPPVHLSSRNGRDWFWLLSFGFSSDIGGMCRYLRGNHCVTRRVMLKHARGGVTASNKAQVLPVGITMIESPYWLIMACGGSCRPFGHSLIGARSFASSVAGNRYVDYFGTQSPRPTESSGASPGMVCHYRHDQGCR